MADDRITAIFKRAQPNVFDTAAAAGRARSGLVPFGEAFNQNRALRLQEARTIGDLLAQQQGLELQGERVGMERERMGLARERMDWERIKLEAEQRAKAGDKEAKIFSDSLAPFTKGISTQATAALYEAAAQEFAEKQPRTVQEGSRIAANIVGALGIQEKPSSTLTFEQRKELETHKASLREDKGTRESRNRESLRRDYPDLSERQIDDIIFNRVTVSTPDKLGNVYLVNKATGTRELVTSKEYAQTAPSTEALPPVGTEAPVVNTPLEEHAYEGGGLGGGLIAFAGTSLEAVFGAEDMAPATEEARNRVRNFKQIAMEALVLNRKFPVAERTAVGNMMPDPERFATSRQDEKRKASDLRKYLKDKRKANLNELEKGKISTERRVTLTDQVSSIDLVLSLMGPPTAGPGSSPDNPVEVTSPEQARNLDPGTYFRTETGELKVR